MNQPPEMTHWRELANPRGPLDPINDPDFPNLEAGKLPLKFTLLVYDGAKLIGPTRFDSEVTARLFVNASKITHYLIIPRPL